MKKVDAQMNFPQMEQGVLQYWQENQIFEKSVNKDAPSGDFVFYDGPPFATGLPHVGHLVPGLVKDIFPRYKTMQGYRVERQWGWDCHGLPIENLVEKELGFKNKKDILEYGVEKFNELCRSKVLSYTEEWKKTMARFGRFVDMDKAYLTMNRDYMESVWWVFKTLWDKGLVYESYRTMHICPRCETTLSQAEVSEGYKDVKDLAVVAKFEVDQTEVDDVAIALIEKDGKILFVYQKEEEQYFFVGGGVEEGETLEETLTRECREELGVEVKASKKLYQSFRIYKGRLKRLHVFETEIVSGEPALQEDQHAELIWRTCEPAQDLYKDLDMNRLNLARSTEYIFLGMDDYPLDVAG
jgi:8-oxo-dGTP pyrophosphatase MutT (NUDIX family)